jgi:nucleoside-diphosphate-sugar epimerase
VKALVTGATGFIGSHLTEGLLKKGIQVRCLLRRPEELKWLKNLPVEVVQGDITHKDSLRKAVKDVDQIYHLAGVTKAIKEKTYFEVNAIGTKNLVISVLEKNPNIQKLVYLSSLAAAGPSRNGSRKESDPCEPISPYGQSKWMGEEFALAHSHELPLIILRPSAVYGPRDRDIYSFFKCLSKRINPCLTGPAQYISLCYVQDLIQAILMATEADTKSGEIFFLSDGHSYSMEEIGDTFAKVMGIHPLRLRLPKQVILGIAFFSEYLSKFSKKPSLINKGKAMEMVQRNWTCDITKAKTVLGFHPQFPLFRGAQLTFDWYKKEKWL